MCISVLVQLASLETSFRHLDEVIKVRRRALGGGAADRRLTPRIRPRTAG